MNTTVSAWHIGALGSHEQNYEVISFALFPVLFLWEHWGRILLDLLLFITPIKGHAGFCYRCPISLRSVIQRKNLGRVPHNLKENL